HTRHCTFSSTTTATTDIYTLSLHDALPISSPAAAKQATPARLVKKLTPAARAPLPAETETNVSAETETSSEMPGANGAPAEAERSEEHTSELQSLAYLVCRLLLEKKKKKQK